MPPVPLLDLWRDAFRCSECTSFSSSVDGTCIGLKSFDITVSESTGDPARRSVSGCPPRRGTFLGEIFGMRSWGGAPSAPPKLLRTSRFAPQPAVVPTLQASLFFPPSFPLPYPARLASPNLTLCHCLTNIHVRLFSVQTRVKVGGIRCHQIQILRGTPP
jgi:hypothetical protein